MLSMEEIHKVQLTRENYHKWKFGMKWLIMGLHLWDLVDDTEVLPERAGHKQPEKFRKQQDLALSKIAYR